MGGAGPLPMLELKNLYRSYRGIPAIEDVSFKVAPGEVVGFLGPNGAGKSTTVKIITGMLRPNDGHVLFEGRDIRHDMVAFRASIGYVPEEAHLYQHLSGREYLQLLGRLRGMGRRMLDARIDEMLRLFSLWEDRHSPLAAYSKGMRQKILISGALLHNPELLILDEPFSGLDVNTALVLRTLIRALSKRGKMVFYSSHVLEVVEKVASSVLILRKGKMVAHDRVENLRDLMQQSTLEGVFAQLTQQEDPGRLVDGILCAMEN